ncbi:MAG: hypothetical protein H6737_07290 [Alphaproteobacteria bacterium]|nr:hypothetical protein [Alphaproteobacteria bacterium]
MGMLDSIKRFFGLEPQPSEGPSASDVMRELRSEKGRDDPEWAKLVNRLATLVLSEADRQRVWQRAHRGEADAARLLSGITSPTPDEKRILADLVRELESGR